MNVVFLFPCDNISLASLKVLPYKYIGRNDSFVSPFIASPWTVYINEFALRMIISLLVRKDTYLYEISHFVAKEITELLLYYVFLDCKLL